MFFLHQSTSYRLLLHFQRYPRLSRLILAILFYSLFSFLPVCLDFLRLFGISSLSHQFLLRKSCIFILLPHRNSFTCIFHWLPADFPLNSIQFSPLHRVCKNQFLSRINTLLVTQSVCYLTSIPCKMNQPTSVTIRLTLNLAICVCHQRISHENRNCCATS